MNELKSILEQATVEERNGFKKILDTSMCESINPDQLVKGFRWLHRNLLEDFYRDVFGKPESYKDILLSVCENLQVNGKKLDSCGTLETKISAKVLETVWSNMTVEQRAEFEKEITKLAESNGKGSEWMQAGGVAGALTLANLGGFSTYILATTALSSVTGIVGLTLPFAAYTTLTTSLSFILGPVGWIGAGLFTIWKISGPNYKKLIPAILYISMIRNKPA